MSKAIRIVAGIVLVIVGAYTGNPALIAYGASLAIGAVLEKKPETLARLQAQSVMVRSAIKAQEIMYGRDKKSGVVTFFGTSGSENQYLWFVITVVEHEIDGYETLWMDSEPVDIATQIDGSGYVTNAKFIDADGNKLVKTKFYTGLDSQTVDTELDAAFTDWTTDHKGEGVAYFWVRLELDRSEGGTDPENPEANVWAKGWPQDLAVTARGAKVYDPREVAHDVADPSTWEWSENPVLCRAHYLMSGRFGPGYLDTEINWTVVATQASICEALTDIPGSETQPRYTMNGVVTVDADPKSIIEGMQTADFGTTLFLPDGVQILAGSWVATSHTIDTSWIAGPVTCESATATDDAYNAVRGQFLSAADGYTVKEFQPRTAPAYETEDAVGRVWQDIVLPFTREEFAAQRLAIIELKKSRQQKKVTLQCNFRAELVEVFQTVELDLLGFDSATFRVLAKATSDEGGTSLQLREEVETDWNYTIPDLATPPVVPSIIRYPDGVPACTALAAITAAEGVRLAWSHPALSNVSHVEVYVATTNDRSTAVLLTKVKGESYFHTLAEDEVRYYWVIARGDNGMLSQWFPLSGVAGIQGTAGGIAAGANAIYGLLDNERHIVTAAPDGTGYDLTGSGGTFHVWDGTADVTGVGPVYSVIAPATVDGLTMAIHASTGVYTLSGASPSWTTDGVAFLLQAVYNSVTLQIWYSIVKSKAGTDGSDAKLLKVAASSQTFKYDTDGDLVGADEIVFTAEQTGSTETIYWVTQTWNAGTSDWDSTVGTYLSTGTGLTTTLTEALFQTAITTEGGGGHDTLRIAATFSDPPAVTYFYEFLTVTKVQDGAAGLDGADGADGAAGINARAVNLTAGDDAFVYNVSGAVPSPANTTVTATAFNTTGTPYYNFLKNDVSVQNTTANTYTYTPQAAFSSMPDKIEVELREGGTGGAILARDQITMTGLREGSDAVTVLVSNEAHVLPTTNTGTVTYTGSGTTVRVFEGATALTYVTSAPGNGQWTFTSVTPLNITAGALSGTTTTTATFADHSAMTADNASLTLTINGKRGSTGNVVFSSLVKIQSLAKSVQGADASLYYIKPTNGTAIHNSTGTLTVEAHKVTGGTDILLSTGTIKLYVGTTLVTVANGYATGSNGYTGVFDSGDITGDVIVLLKDGSGGTVLDSITLVDIADGGEGADAVYGYIEPSAPISWTRAADQSTWTPAATTVDLDVTFVQAGVTVARDAMRITRTAGGILTSSATTHPLGDLNTSRITITTTGSSSQAISIKYDYLEGSNTASVAETVITSMAGTDGTDAVFSQLTVPIMTALADETGFLVTLDSVSGVLEDSNGVTKFGTHNVYDGASNVTTSATHSLVGGTIQDADLYYKEQNGLRCYVYRTNIDTGEGSYFFYAASGQAWTTDEETFTLRANYGGVDYDKQVSISKLSGEGNNPVRLKGENYFTDKTPPTSGTCTIGFRLDNDKNQKANLNTGTYANLGSNPLWLWNGTNTTDYDCYATVLSTTGATPSGTFDTWLDLASDQTWSIATTDGAHSITIINIQIRRTATSEVLGDKTITLDAWVNLA